MAATATPSMQIATTNPCISASQSVFKPSIAFMGTENKGPSCARLRSSYHISSTLPLSQNLSAAPLKLQRFVPKEMSEASDLKPLPGLSIDLRGCVWKLLSCGMEWNGKFRRRIVKKGKESYGMEFKLCLFGSSRKGIEY